MPKKKKMMIHTILEPIGSRGGKWTYRQDQREVEVMATAKGYAMVRRPGCMPYVAFLNDLSDKEAPHVADNK